MICVWDELFFRDFLPAASLNSRTRVEFPLRRKLWQLEFESPAAEKKVFEFP